MTLSNEDVEGLATFTKPPKKGKKRTIAITVDYRGGPEKSSASYKLWYLGNAVDIATGQVDCLGDAGDTDSNRYVLHFIALPGDKVADVSFRNPTSPNTFYFVAGEQDMHDCVSKHDDEEFEEIMFNKNSDRLDLVNKKVNSKKRLGYKFKLWITVEDSTLGSVEVEFDPRIINV
jgi:hypothetical protein